MRIVPHHIHTTSTTLCTFRALALGMLLFSGSPSLILPLPECSNRTFRNSCKQWHYRLPTLHAWPTWWQWAVCAQSMRRCVQRGGDPTPRSPYLGGASPAAPDEFNWFHQTAVSTIATLRKFSMARWHATQVDSLRQFATSRQVPHELSLAVNATSGRT